MAMMSLLVVSSHYPFGSGEQFLEDELRYWIHRRDVDIKVLPRIGDGPKRSIAGLQTFPAQSRRRPSRISRAGTACLHPREVLTELGAQKSGGWPSLARILKTLTSLGERTMWEVALERTLSHIPEPKGVYTYWLGAPTYAAIRLRDRGLANFVLSRAHGYDLYEYRARSNVQVMARRCLPAIDRLSVVSDDGSFYARNHLGVPDSIVTVDRLGVEVPSDLGPRPMPDQIRIATISAATAVKRLHLVRPALERLAERLPGTSIRWDHFGDGPTLPTLKREVQKAKGSHVQVHLHGHVASGRLRNLLGQEPFSVLLNLSSSEGVPVSMMEAMANGVPVVATDVGGVSELVGEGTGRLVAPESSPDAIADALIEVCRDSQSDAYRLRVQDFVRMHYSAADNYRGFADSVVQRWSGGPDED